MTLSLILALVFCGTIGTLLLASEMVRRRGRSVQRRLGRVTMGGTAGIGSEARVAAWPGTGGRGARRVAHDYLPFVTRTLEKRNLIERVKLEVAQAGLRLRPSEYVAVIALSTLAFPAAALLLTRSLLILGALAIGGFCLPQVVIKLLQ